MTETDLGPGIHSLTGRAILRRQPVFSKSMLDILADKTRRI